MERQSFEIIESGNTTVKINWAINNSSSIGVSNVPWNMRTRYKSNQNGAEMIYHQNQDTQIQPTFSAKYLCDPESYVRLKSCLGSMELWSPVWQKPPMYSYITFSWTSILNILYRASVSGSFGCWITSYAYRNTLGQTLQGLVFSTDYAACKRSFTDWSKVVCGVNARLFSNT